MKGVAQLGQQSQQSLPPLVVSNQYGSNLDLLGIPGGQIVLDQLDDFFKEIGLDINQMLLGGDIPSAQQVNTWKIFEHGKSLYNLAALSDLGTQMYLLNKWYMEACARKETWLLVRIRHRHYFCCDDIIHVPFSKLHQLCHMDALDKSLVSCYCL